MTSLRRATQNDAASLCELGRRTFLETFVEGFRINYPAEDLQTYLAGAYTPQAFTRMLADPASAAWVVEDGGEAVAYATAGPNGLPHPEARATDGELRRLYVRGDRQALGLGRTLLETALTWLQARDPGPIWIGVWSGNRRAQRLYARYGFSKAGEYEFPVGRVRDREFILRRG